MTIHQKMNSAVIRQKLEMAGVIHSLKNQLIP